jgi:hypothetical protein
MPFKYGIYLGFSLYSKRFGPTDSLSGGAIAMIVIFTLIGVVLLCIGLYFGYKCYMKKSAGAPKNEEKDRANSGFLDIN